MDKISSFSCLLDDRQAQELKNYLESSGYEFKVIPHAHFCAFKNRLIVTLYRSRKLVIQGAGTNEFVEFVLEPLILKKAVIGYEAVYDSSLLIARVGVDESGKGDYFGPLCIAGVYVNGEIIKSWKGLRIRDSKEIQSDNTVIKLADAIKKTVGCRYSIVTVGNEAYNKLFKSMGNVNKILAWGHARVIENLLSNFENLNPFPQKVICDQFANSKDVIVSALMKYGRGIEVEQRHKAETDVAVAAASILARCEFITRLNKLGKKYGIELPRGASSRVEEVAIELVKKHGEDVLSKIAKIHFKTTEKILVRYRSLNGSNSKNEL